MATLPQTFFSLGPPLGRRPRTTWAVVILISIAVVWWLDYVTGFEVGMIVAYLLPVFLATWTIGRTAGVATACLCVAVWILSFAGKQPPPHPLIFAWDGLVQFSVYLIFVL